MINDYDDTYMVYEPFFFLVGAERVGGLSTRILLYIYSNPIMIHDRELS